MRSLKCIAIGILLCALIAMFLVYVYPRYYILDGSRNGIDIAQEILDRKRDPAECSHILDFDPFPSPSADEQSRLCVYHYAELTKDPSACELLMPSSYGLSCVGAAESHELPCATEAYSVYWNDGNNSKIATLKECNTSDPKRTLLGNQCCQIAKVRYLLSENDCSSFSGKTDLHDRCLYDLAWKTRNPIHCNNISNENAHNACEVQTKALKQDPSICTGCTLPVENVDQLPK